jgi:anaerobic dimethyl sulfoxide reductase subunit B
VSRYAFHLDLKNCTGCKACQVACKEKNGLTAGLLWRRVVEVSSGSWQARGPAWIANTYTYFLSTACCHCEEPICLEVCPTRAITQREDGIVMIDSERCIGCRYCEWACPYGAPRFDPETGLMSKCDFCADRIDESLPPVCVSACQMRVLEFDDLDELQAKYGGTHSKTFFPLPQPDLTRPAVTFELHPDVQDSETSDAGIGNKEELQLED